jgi:hypothetical protein
MGTLEIKQNFHIHHLIKNLRSNPKALSPVIMGTYSVSEQLAFYCSYLSKSFQSTLDVSVSQNVDERAQDGGEDGVYH